MVTTREEYPVNFFLKGPNTIVRYQSKQWRHLLKDEISRSVKVEIYQATLLWLWKLEYTAAVECRVSSNENIGPFKFGHKTVVTPVSERKKLL